MDLNKALVSHTEWRTKLRVAVKNREPLDASKVGRDDRCELGQWLAGPARKQFGTAPELERLRIAHREFHQELGKVAQFLTAKDYAAADKELTLGFEASAKSVALAFHHLRRIL